MTDTLTNLLHVCEFEYSTLKDAPDANSFITDLDLMRLIKTLEAVANDLFTWNL